MDHSKSLSEHLHAIIGVIPSPHHRAHSSLSPQPRVDSYRLKDIVTTVLGVKGGLILHLYERRLPASQYSTRNIQEVWTVCPCDLGMVMSST